MTEETAEAHARDNPGHKVLIELSAASGTFYEICQEPRCFFFKARAQSEADAGA